MRHEFQSKRLEVNILSRTKATSETIFQVRPDVVIFATGSKPLIPAIPGIEYAVVADGPLLGRSEVDKKATVVSGEFVGIETAIQLAMGGRDVTVVEALLEIARDVEPVSKIALLRPGGY